MEQAPEILCPIPRYMAHVTIVYLNFDALVSERISCIKILYPRCFEYVFMWIINLQRFDEELETASVNIYCHMNLKKL